jgi:hypothetical protein
MSNSWSEFFSKIRYKPNFTIDYSNAINFDRESIIVKMLVPDSRDPDNFVKAQPMVGWGHEARRIPLLPVTSTFILEQWHGEEYAKGWLRNVLRQMEDHELDEWLRYEDELMNDPHA